MASYKKRFNLDDERDILKIHKLLFEDSDEENTDKETNDKQEEPDGQSTTRYDVEDEEYDTDASEQIEERQENSDSEQSNSDTSSDEDDKQDLYVAERKKNNKIVDSFTWKKTPYRLNKKTAKQNLLKKLPGVIGPARNAQGILQSWMCLFSEAMLDMVVKFTNQYIDIVKENYSRTRDALPTDKVEIKAFVGLLYIAGQYKGGRLNLEDFWDTDGFGVEIFRLTMSLKRFRFLFQAVRFDDRTTREERKKTDRLAPIRDIFQQFVANCQASYSLGENVTLDEKLEAFRGRCAFIQYIPSKPAKYGIKIFALVDSKMFYTSNLEIYAGKQPEGSYALSNKSLDVVERLIAPIHNSGRNVTADNWFSDVSLLKDLADNHRLSYVGTLKKNKWQIPKPLKDIKDREIFSSVFAYTKEGTLVSYVPQNKSNKKNVLVISSMHHDGIIDNESGTKKKPEIITYYNKTKVGVDIVDKMCSTYNVARNTRRWSMVVFFSMLNIAGINAQVIYLGNGNDIPPRRTFLKLLGKELLQEQLMRRSMISTLPTTISLRLKELSKTNPSTTEKANEGNIISESSKSRKRCKPCQQEKKTRLTRYSCNSCGAYLCLQHSRFVCQEECGQQNLPNEELEDNN